MGDCVEVEKIPYKNVEEHQIACDETSKSVALKYKPDLVIFGNPSNNRTIHVSFDEKVKQTSGLPLNPNSVLKVPLQVHEIHAIADGGNPTLYITALAYRRVGW